MVSVGSSGGARPKAQIYIPAGDARQCPTYAQPGYEGWLIKFTSQNLALGHEEGLCEAVYSQMAEKAKCQPPIWQLIKAPESSRVKSWLALKRFDYIHNQFVVGKQSPGAGRLHMHSACGLLDADFRTPSLDLATLLKRVVSFVCPMPLDNFNFVALSLIYLRQTKMTTVKTGVFYKGMMATGNSHLFMMLHLAHIPLINMQRPILGM